MKINDIVRFKNSADANEANALLKIIEINSEIGRATVRHLNPAPEIAKYGEVSYGVWMSELEISQAWNGSKQPWFQPGYYWQA